MDYSITGLTVSDIPGLNNALQAITTKRVTFYVGTRGPFYVDFAPVEYTHDKVIACVMDQVNTLKKIDAGLGVT